MNEIEHTLTRLFDRHRIVFWYDLKQELQAEYEALALPGVTKIRLDNNQFGVKYRLLRQEPGQKFLLYQPGPPPVDLDNWLLDVELAHGRFYADQIALWLAELERKGLPLPALDFLIATLTGHYHCTMVTRNEKDYQDSGITHFAPWPLNGYTDDADLTDELQIAKNDSSNPCSARTHYTHL